MSSSSDLAYARIASHVFGQPLLLAEDQGLVIGEFIAGRMTGMDPKANRFLGGDDQFDEESGRSKWKGYRRDGNVATINIHGELVNRGAWLGASSGLTSYEGINEQLRKAEADDKIEKIILDINSPGGEAAGMLETSQAIRALSEKKEVIAVVNGLAASAGYGLACGASRIVMARSASVGSIGVLVLHLDYSKRLEDVGVKATLIHAGARKVDGHPYGPLEGAALENIKSRVDQVMSEFVKLVNSHRPQMTKKSIRALEARILLGPEAMEAGLTDEIGTYEGLFSSLKAAPNGQNSQRNISMNVKSKTLDPEGKGITQQQMDKAITEAAVTAKADGLKEGAETAVKRLQDIMSADGVKGSPDRVAAAFDLACKAPSMSVEDVAEFAKAHTAETSSSDASLSNRTDDEDDLPGDEASEGASDHGWGHAVKAAGVAAA